MITNTKANTQTVKNTHLFPLYKTMVGGLRFGSNLHACSDNAIAMPDIFGFIFPVAVILNNLIS